MADPRTFVLIGNFEDNITPSLEKINNSIANLKRTFSGLSSRRGGYADITKSVGSLVSSQKHLANSVKEVKNAVTDAIPHLKEYRKEVGKAASANFAFARSTGQAARNESNLWRQATKEAEAYKRMAKAAASASRSVGATRQRGGMAMPPPPPPGAPPRGAGGGYSGGGYRGSVARDATFAFGQTLGYQLSNTITGSIVQGFQIGVGLMVKPFQYFMDGFSERVKDESTDVQTAGAMFAIAQRKNMDMFENFNQAIRAQQQINYKLAQSAAALPGATTEYVQMGKRVLDSMMTVLSKDVKGVSAFAQELDPNLKAGDKQGALATLTQKFTEKAVLLGQGSTYRGNYGVPQLLEQLIGKEQVSENMFNKFAMYRDLPIFQSVFKDMEGEIAKTGAYSAERIRLVFQLLDEALPNEVIQAHKNTMSGFLEAMRSAFLDPEVGLFGLGRKIQGMEMAMVDQYGNFVNEQGQIVESWDKAAKEQISLYESIQKILTGFGLPLSELATYLPQLFEPFAKLITPLESMFKVAQGFYRNFNIYTKEFEGLAKSLFDAGDKKGAATMKKSAGARGTLLAISNLLTSFGDMSEGKFKDISTKLQQPEADMGAIAKEVMGAVFNSSFIEQLGYQIGLMVGGVLSTVAQLLGLTKGAADTRIVTGLKKGFEDAGGTEAFRSIFSNLFQLIFKVIKNIFMMAPAQITALIGSALTVPALMAGISVAIGNLIEDLIDHSLDALRDRAKATKLKNLPKIPTELPPLPTGVDPITGKTIPALDPRTQPAPKVKPTKAGRLKNFLKSAVGADDSLLGRPLVNLVKNIRASLSGLVGKLATLKPLVTSFGTFLDLLIDGLGILIGKIPGIQQLAKFAEDWMDFGFKPAAANAAKGFKNFFAGGKGGLASLFGKGKGLLGGLLGGAKGAGGGLKGLFGKGLKGLGKFGGIATAGVGIVEALMSLLSGDSLGTALGKGAGPVIGTIIGTALLGPLGGFIGGMIGSMESVTEPLGQAFESVVQTLGVTFEFLGQAGKDLLGVLNWIGKNLFGMGEGFDALRAVIFALLSPFRLLELGIRGLYVLYLQMKANLGLASKEEKENLEKQKSDLATRTAQFAIDEAEQLRGVSKTKQLEEAKAELARIEAKRLAASKGPGGKRSGSYSAGPSQVEKDLKLRIGMLEGQVKDAGRAKGTKAKLGGKEVEWTGSKWVPTSQAPKQEDKSAKDAPKNIKEISDQAGAQVKGIAQVKTGTEKTTTAVKELTAKITAQTSVQTTVAAIYNLLASGSLRVNGTTTNTPGTVVYRQGDPYNPDLGIPDLKNGGWWWNNINLPKTKPAPNQKVSATYPSTTLGDTQVASLYTPAGAGAGAAGDLTVNAPITVNGAGQNAEEIATLVAFKLSEAVADARAASIFV